MAERTLNSSAKGRCQRSGDIVFDESIRKGKRMNELDVFWPDCRWQQVPLGYN